MSAYANVYFKIIYECLRQINIHRSEVHCGSAFEPGGSGLPYYCTPPVCVPAVLGALGVWRLSKKKMRYHRFYGTIDSMQLGIKYHTGVHCGSAVRFGQAVPAYLITAHHLCAFLMYLAR